MVQKLLIRTTREEKPHHLSTIQKLKAQTDSQKAIKFIKEEPNHGLSCNPTRFIDSTLVGGLGS